MTVHFTSAVSLVQNSFNIWMITSDAGTKAQHAPLTPSRSVGLVHPQRQPGIIQEAHIVGQTADFNSSAGAEIKVVTKRGTNSWHGTGYEYYKDNNWSSNTWQNNELNYIPGDHIGLPSYHYSRFGAAIGGPIIPKEILGGKTYGFFKKTLKASAIRTHKRFSETFRHLRCVWAC